MRRLFLLGLLALAPYAPPLVAPAEAGGPRASEGEEAVAYLDELNRVAWNVGQTLLAQSHETYDVADPAALERRVTAAHAVLVTGRDQAVTWPAFRGDTRLRDAVAKALADVDTLYVRDLPKLVAIVATEPPTPESEAALEAAWRALDEETKRIDDEEWAAVQAFAGAHHVDLHATELTDPNPEVPFEAPEIVPAGSVVPANVHAVLVVGYRNAALRAHAGVLDGWQRITSLPTEDFAALEGARAEYVRALDATIATVRALPAFRGDVALRDAVVGEAERIRAAMAGDYAAYLQLASGGPLPKKEYERASAALGATNDAVQGAQAGVFAALAAYDGRWKVAEYQAWLEARRGAAPVGAGEGVGAVPAPNP